MKDFLRDLWELAVAAFWLVIAIGFVVYLLRWLITDNDSDGVTAAIAGLALTGHRLDRLAAAIGRRDL